MVEAADKKTYLFILKVRENDSWQILTLNTFQST